MISGAIAMESSIGTAGCELIASGSLSGLFPVASPPAVGGWLDRHDDFARNRGVAGSREIAVGFLYVGPLSKIAQIMVASVRAAMPRARVIQMTDYATKPVTGVDQAIRKRWDGKTLMTYRLEHLRDFPPGNAVFLDADVVVRKDLAHLFDDEFDVALTYRDETDPSLRLTPEAYEKMPFN